MAKGYHRKKENFNKAVNFVVWLIGMAALIYHIDAVVAAISIWGVLGLTMLWAIFCIRQS